MVLYFPILSSGGNPRASPEETNAPASTSLLLILLTRGRSPTRPFPLCATESLCIYSRCVSFCVRAVCVLCESSGFTRTPDVGEGKRCMRACWLVYYRPCLQLPSSTQRLPLSAHTCHCVRVCVLLILYHSDFFFDMPPHWMQNELFDVSIMNNIWEISCKSTF